MKPGPGWTVPFDQSPYSIRFELGGDHSNLENPVVRFSQAYDRARAVAGHVFSASQRLFGIVMWTEEPEGRTGDGDGSGLAELQAIGFDTSKPIASWEGLPPWLENDKDETTGFFWAAFDLSSSQSQRDILLWCSIAGEMPIAPRAAVVSFIVDPDTDIVLHVYDDRGMDLTGLAAEGIAECYRRFDPWLLDYDRPRMAGVFGA